MMNVNSSTTTLTFTAPSLPDGVFTGTVVVMVTAINRYGMGPASDPAIAIIDGQYLCTANYPIYSYLHVATKIFTYSTLLYIRM